MKSNTALFCILITFATSSHFLHSMEQEYHPLTEAFLILDIKEIANTSTPEINYNVAKIEKNMLAIEKNIRIPVLCALLDGAKNNVEVKKCFSNPFFQNRRQHPHKTFITPWSHGSIKRKQTDSYPLTIYTPINAISTGFVVQYHNGEQLASITEYPIGCSNLEHYNQIIEQSRMICSTNKPSNGIELINFFVTIPVDESCELLLDPTQLLLYYALQKLVKDELTTITPVTTELIPYKVMEMCEVIKMYGKKRHHDERVFQITLHDDGATVALKRGHFLKEIPLLK